MLVELGVHYPTSSGAASLSIARQLLGLKLRGIAFTPRPGQELELARADLYWSLGKGLIAVRPSQGMACLLRSLRFALKAGEPVRIGRSLGCAGPSW